MRIIFCTYPVGFSGPLGSDSDYKQVGDLKTNSNGVSYVAWANPTGFQKPKNNTDGSDGMVPSVSGDSRSLQMDGSVQTRNADTAGPFEQVAFDGSALTSLPTEGEGFVTLAKATF